MAESYRRIVGKGCEVPLHIPRPWARSAALTEAYCQGFSDDYRSRPLGEEAPAARLAGYRAGCRAWTQEERARARGGQ